MSIEGRSPVFVAQLPGGTVAQALPSDFDHAVEILGRLLPVLPPVDSAYIVPSSTVREAKQ